MKVRREGRKEATATFRAVRTKSAIAWEQVELVLKLS